MHIVCPHCTTSYAIDSATLGGSGRTVRCSRCKEVWLARPEDVVEIAAAAPVMASAQDDAADEWERMAAESAGEAQNMPVVDSPSISADWPAEDDAQVDWQSAAHDQADELNQARSPWLSRLRHVFSFRPKAARQGAPRRPFGRLLSPSFAGLPTACVAMGALVLALVIWRADVVRLMPQTAAFYKVVGLEVNLRGLTFKNVKITRETSEGKPVLVIEGAIVGETAKPVELPRLRFSVRDERGTEIYAWNAVIEQAVLKPGERAKFKSRLASPPPEGRNIDVRFFNKRDIAGGNT